MNRRRLRHRASVSRIEKTRVNGKTTVGAPAVAVPSLACWAEGIGPKQRSLLVGRNEQARYTLTWMDDLLKPEDQITMTTPALGTFVLRGIQHDVQGGYWFGTLEERS